MSLEPDISVVAPCHNERENLGPLTEAVRAALEPLQLAHEIVIVDDCSSDDSWETIRRLGSQDPRVRGQRFAENRGQSAALWAGIKAARGRIIVTLDADLQNPPAEIPRFLAALADADCVCGSRVAARSRGDGRVRRLSSKIANAVRNRVSDESISDAGCCFRAFKRECVAEVKFFRGAHRFLPTLIRMEGFTVTEIAIGHAPRHAGRSHYGVWNRLFSASVDLLAVRWMNKRFIRYSVADRVN